MPIGHKVSPETAARILETLKTRPELTYEQIGALFGLSAGPVHSVVRKHGNQKPRKSPEPIVELLRTRPDLKYRQISQMVGVSESMVETVAQQYGLGRHRNRRRSNPLPEDMRAKILAELQAAHNSTDHRRPVTEIAKKFGVTLIQVTNIQAKAGLRFRKYRSFEPAREWARASGITRAEDWSKSLIPRDIPSNPNETYRNKGWISWPDFLGNNRWTISTVLAYLRDIQSTLPNLSDADLLKLLRETGLLPYLSLQGNGHVADLLRALRANQLPQRLTEKGILDESVQESDYESPETRINPHIADHAKGLRASADTIQHIIESQLAALRAKWFQDGSAVAALALLSPEGGEFFQEIARRFREEVVAVESLATPWWGLHKKAKPVPPSPMQKYVAWRMKKDRVLGNWSGTGAGKTGSAGLTAYVIGSELTVVLAANSTMPGWREQLEETFPESRVYTKVSEVERGAGAFLILNYERFQTNNAGMMAKQVVELNPHLVVLDEVQLVKQRDGETSTRSVVIREMLSKLPQVCVLGMSATPVINELREGISLLETIRRKTLALRTRHTIPNALDVFAALRQTGIRYIPKYEQVEQTIPVSTQRDDLFGPLQNADDILPIEQILLPAKLEAIKDRITPGTVLYLEYVEGMVEPVRVFMESLGYRVGEYVGKADTTDRERAKKQFIDGEIDVLIGSRAISVGVDGLQQRCDQLVILSLPWTHAAYAQLVGRVYRQGGVGTVQIVIPQVIIGSNSGRWSWDEARLKHIESKRTLAECATDGVIPTTSTLSRKVLAMKAIEALNKLSKKAKASAV
jgi:superfamily II DNA or RNA helicase/transposase